MAEPDRLSVDRRPLGARHILVVEDAYLIADDLSAALREEGAVVVGPAASVPKGMRLAAEEECIDAAILNVDLRGVAVFPLADALIERGIPFLFLTGYGQFNIPDEYGAIVRCEKPVGALHVVCKLKELLGPVSVAA